MQDLVTVCDLLALEVGCLCHARCKWVASVGLPSLLSAPLCSLPGRAHDPLGGRHRSRDFPGKIHILKKRLQGGLADGAALGHVGFLPTAAALPSSGLGSLGGATRWPSCWHGSPLPRAYMGVWAAPGPPWHLSHLPLFACRFSSTSGGIRKRGILSRQELLLVSRRPLEPLSVSVLPPPSA